MTDEDFEAMTAAYFAALDKIYAMLVNLMPMTGPVDLSRWLAREAWWCQHCKAGVELSEAAWHGFNNPASDAYCPTCDTALDAACSGIGWVRVGGDEGAQ